MADEITIKVDKFHWQLICSIGAILLLVGGGFQALDIWDLQRRAEDRQRLSNLEGQVKAISEAIQHE